MTDKTDRENKTPRKKSSEKDPKRLKAAWEQLMRRQDAAFNARHVSKSAEAISSVRIVNDGEKGERVEISTVSGRKISDGGEKAVEFGAMAAEAKSQKNSYSLDALIQEVKEHGFENVADDLPPDVARALKAACERSGVSLDAAVERKKEAAFQAAMMAKDTAERKAEQAERQKNHKPPAAFSLDKELKHLMAMSNRIAINTRRSQTKLHLTKSRMVSEQRKRFETEKSNVRNTFNEMQIDAYRRELFGPKGKAKVIEQKLKDGLPLTQSEQALWNKKERYGLQAHPERENPTPEQIRARSQMSVRDYNKDLTRQYNEAIARKKAIFTTKVKALETASEQIQLHLAHGKKMNVDRDVLEEYAVKLMPTRDQLTTNNLRKTCAKLQKHKTKLHSTVVQVRERRKNEIEEKLQNAMRNGGVQNLQHVLHEKKEKRSPVTAELLQQTRLSGKTR